MALSTAAKKSLCATCEKNTGIFTCGGCTRAFCTKHANEHRQLLGKQMDEIVSEHDQLRHYINEQIDGIDQHSSLKEIDDWERRSIDKICRAAEKGRQKLKQCLRGRTQYTERVVKQLTEKLNQARMEDDFVETDLKLWSDKINQLKVVMSTSIPIFVKSIDGDLISFVSHPEDDTEIQINESQVNSTTDTTPSAFATNEDDFYPRVIELPKTAETLGFHVVGGREQNFPIYISRIIPNGVAWRHGGLKKGDQLLSVNGVSVENEYHDKAVDLFKRAHGSVKLVVRYLPQVVIEIENLC